MKDFKLQFAHLINEASRTTQIGLFNFRAFLNVGMLLTESEKAKRKKIDTICERETRPDGSYFRSCATAKCRAHRRRIGSP